MKIPADLAQNPPPPPRRIPRVRPWGWLPDVLLMRGRHQGRIQEFLKGGGVSIGGFRGGARGAHYKALDVGLKCQENAYLAL